MLRISPNPVGFGISNTTGIGIQDEILLPHVNFRNPIAFAEIIVGKNWVKMINRFPRCQFPDNASRITVTDGNGIDIVQISGNLLRFPLLSEFTDGGVAE